MKDSYAVVEQWSLRAMIKSSGCSNGLEVVVQSSAGLRAMHRTMIMSAFTIDALFQGVGQVLTC